MGQWGQGLIFDSSLELWRKERARKAALILMKNSHFVRTLRYAMITSQASCFEKFSPFLFFSSGRELVNIEICQLKVYKLIFGTNLDVGPLVRDLLDFNQEWSIFFEQSEHWRRSRASLNPDNQRCCFRVHILWQEEPKEHVGLKTVQICALSP